jgi:hypothetical protein
VGLLVRRHHRMGPTSESPRWLRRRGLGVRTMPSASRRSPPGRRRLRRFAAEQHYVSCSARYHTTFQRTRGSRERLHLPGLLGGITPEPPGRPRSLLDEDYESLLALSQARRRPPPIAADQATHKDGHHHRHPCPVRATGCGPARWQGPASMRPTPDGSATSAKCRVPWLDQIVKETEGSRAEVARQRTGEGVAPREHSARTENAGTYSSLSDAEASRPGAPWSVAQRPTAPPYTNQPRSVRWLTRSPCRHAGAPTAARSAPVRARSAD